jgi:hypothetical protein
MDCIGLSKQISQLFQFESASVCGNKRNPEEEQKHLEKQKWNKDFFESSGSRSFYQE